MAAERLLLYARTLSQLRTGQIARLARRRLFPAASIGARRAVATQLRAGTALRTSLPAPPPGPGERGAFRFLNVTKRFRGGRVDWSCQDMSRLWRYNLHYFDYVLDRRPWDEISSLVSDWIARNPLGRAPGWEPYPTSLRIVNWAKLFLRIGPASVPDPWLESLHRQARWLEDRIEYELLANHLLKNGKALFFAGAFFAGEHADRWLRKGLQILVGEAREQILADGGHFERSPMYHAIAVEDYLDALNLIGGTPSLATTPADFLASKARAALDFLHSIGKPDGSIPLFNDSALGIAPPFSVLADYAERVIDYRPPARPQGLRVASLVATGYFVARHGDDMLVVDCGAIGPDYQPGHAHCDTLSFELVCGGRALVVDSGVCDYEDAAMRRYVRSTRAHNTASVDGCEQSEIWGAFRVARRARPIRADMVKIDASRARFSGSHDGFSRLRGRPVHAREIDYRTDGVWTIVDRLTGKGEHRIDTFVHLHPDLEVRLLGRAVSVADGQGNAVARVEPLDGADVALESGWYCPEFGVRRPNVAVRFSVAGALPRSIAYQIVKA